METVSGHLQGLKSSQMKELQRLYDRREPSDRLVSPEFAEKLAAISSSIARPVCCYINRRGEVIRVGVGTPDRVQIPPEEVFRQSNEYLSGIRCIVTQIKAGIPDEATLTAMERQRLDALVLLNVNRVEKKRGKPASKYVKEAYLVYPLPHPEKPWVVSGPKSLDELSDMAFDELVFEWGIEFEEAGYETFLSRDIVSDRDKVLLVGLMTYDLSPQQFDDGIEELIRLVESAGGEVLDVLVTQKRSHPHPQTVVGHGKVEEIAEVAHRMKANLIVFNRDISPSQARNLEEQIGIRVIDRTEVILDIFAQRAQSQAGKLQVELAQLEYMLPRLRGRGQEMSRLGGGIGTRGPGETKLETERRTIQHRITHLQHEINLLQAHRARLRQQRKEQEIPTIALVGYTNAGKSTLLNVLTHAEVYTADRLFATLDPTTRKLVIANPETQERKTVLLTDTVGFIHELPPPLVDAFRATLEEVMEADAMLHVVDLSHPAWESQIQSVIKVLAEMPAIPGRSLIAFNKVDLVNSETLDFAKQNYPEAVFISATERLGLDTLKQRLLQLIGEPVSAMAIVG